MRTIRIAMMLLAALGAAAAARAQEPPAYPGNDQGQPAGDQGPDQPAGPDMQGAAPADPEAASIDYFHDQLSPYGQWVERDGYGMVWVPQVDQTWRPYTTGHWAYTDQGWAWVADEPWGWAPFHYGRWYYDQEIGWGWVPGTVWAPAWVSWRNGGGYLGWAPLPPAVGFSVGVGLDLGGVVISPGFYTFVGERDILAPRVSAVIVPSVRNVTIVNSTTIYNNYTVVGGRVINAGVPVAHVEAVIGRPVPRVTVAAMAAAGSGGRHGAFYQPPIVARAAVSGHAEFGHALARQVSVQQKSRSFAAVSRSQSGHFAVGGNNPKGNQPPGRSGGAHGNGQQPSGSAGGVRGNGQQGQGSAGGFRGNGQQQGQGTVGGFHGNGQQQGQGTAGGPHGSGQPAAGTAGSGHGNGQPTTGTAGSGHGNGQQPGGSGAKGNNAQGGQGAQGAQGQPKGNQKTPPPNPKKPPEEKKPPTGT